MNSTYPNNPDGYMLRRVVEDGSNMARPMTIDFSIAVADEGAAHRVADLVEAHGFDPSIHCDDDDGSWSVFCAKSMLATYDGVVAVQAQLKALVEPHGGACDGWTTFGNSHDGGGHLDAV
jgi:regulator of RNase E activity RraB